MSIRAPSGAPSRSGRLSPSYPEVVIAVVRNLYRGQDGRQYIDCASAGIAPASLERIPIYTTGGGGYQGGNGNRYRQSSVSIDGSEAEPINPDQTPAAQAALLLSGPYRRPVFLGFVQHPRHGAVSSVAAPSKTEDRSKSFTVEDDVIANGGGVLILDSRGAPVIDTTGATDGNVRVQMPSEGVLRLSRAGDASGRVMSADNGISHLESVRETLAALKTAVESISSQLVTIAAAIPASYTPVGTIPNPPTPGAGLKLAAIHVAPDDEGF